MKTIYSFFLFLGFSGALLAQDCNKWFPMQQGSEYEITNYANGKLLTSVNAKVTEVSRGTNTQATIEQEVFDKNHKNIGTGTGNVLCEGNNWYFNIVASPSTPGSDAQMKISENTMTIPNDLNVGTNLPDGKIVMQSTINGSVLMNLTTIETERKCVAKESLTTPAGTFDCYKITSKAEIKGVMSMKQDMTYWYAEGVGMVKTESFRNGKSTGYSLMTKFKK